MAARKQNHAWRPGQTMQLRLLPLCVCTVGFCLFIALNYPGFVSFDTIEQALDARDGVYGDWHPPIMAFLWHLIEKVIPGTLGMLIVNALLLWAGTYLIAVTWFKGDGRNVLWSLAPCLIIFFPPIFSISGAIWKDILMWALVVLAIGLSGALRPWTKGVSWTAGAKLGVALVPLLLAISVRYNAVFTAAPIAILCVARSIGTRPFRMTTAVGIGILITLLLFFLSGQINRVLTTHHRNPWVSVAVFDIAGIISRTSDRNEQESYYMSVPERLRGEVSVDTLLRTYSSVWWLTTFKGERPAFVCPSGPEISEIHHLFPLERCFQLNKKELRAVRALWIRAIAEHPVAWLSHRLSVFGNVIGATPAPQWLPVFIWPDSVLTKPYGYALSPGLIRVQSWMQGSFDRLAETWFYRPWVYLALTVCICVLCLWSRTEARQQIALIAASGLAQEIGLFFLAPSPDYRYSHYMIYTVVLASALWLRTEPLFRRSVAWSRTAVLHLIRRAA